MKRLLLIATMLTGAFTLVAAPVRRQITAEEPKETQTLVAHRKQPTTGAQTRRRAPAAQKVKISGSVQKYYDKQRLKRFVHFLRIYSNPKANHATKARAAHRLIALQKQIKNPRYRAYINKELQRHHVTSAALQKEARFAGSYLKFNHLVNKYAKRKKQKKFAKLQSPLDQKESKTLTQIHNQLPADYKKGADRILQAKGITLDELHQASQPMQKLTPAKTAAQPAS
jgi:hypothetical protein